MLMTLLPPTPAMLTVFWPTNNSSFALENKYVPLVVMAPLLNVVDVPEVNWISLPEILVVAVAPLPNVTLWSPSSVNVCRYDRAVCYLKE